jgi:predicted DNA-binding transcriptional regulator AlpA
MTEQKSKRREVQHQQSIRTRKETAERLRISLRTLSRLEQKGLLGPRIRITDRVIGYADTTIDQYIESRTA